MLPTAEDQISEEAMDQERRTTEFINSETNYQSVSHTKEAMEKEMGMKSKKRKRDQIQENNKDDDNNPINQDCDNHDSDDYFFSELLPPIMNNNSSSRPPQLLNLTQSLMLPWRLMKKIEEMGCHDIKLIIEKKLHKSDVNPRKNRFSIPENQILKEFGHFLEPQEVDFLKDQQQYNKCQGIGVLMLDQNLQEFNLILKRWQINTSITYNLTNRWNYVVRSNDFKDGDKVQLWLFRRLDEQLGFAVVKLIDQ